MDGFYGNFKYTELSKIRSILEKNLNQKLTI